MKKSTSLLWLLRCIFLRIEASNAHFLWAEIDSTGGGVSNNVNVVFSEKAGIPDPTIEVLAKRVVDSGMDFISAEKGASVALEDRGDHLVGKIDNNSKTASSNNYNDDDDDNDDDPFLVSGFLDFGPFPIEQPPPDLQYTFVAQKYSEESDWDNFFQQLYAPYFAVLMVSGTMCGPPYRVAITGADFDPAQTEIDVCLFEKGGKQIGCTHNDPDGDETNTDVVEEKEDDNHHRRIFLTIDEKEENDNKSLLRNRENLVMLDDDAPKYVYALANATIGETGSKVLKFASTSIELNGDCDHGLAESA